MSHLKYYNYAGVGEANNKALSYSQAVRRGNEIIISGQGGWIPEKNGMVVHRDLEAQYDQAFSNVDLALRTAGGKGWSQVYQVRSYHLPLNNEAMEIMARGLRKWCPDHQPVLTAVGVPRLGNDDMRVEIEVVALDEPSQE